MQSTTLKIVPYQFAQFGPKLPLFGNGVSFDDDILPGIGNYVIGAVSALPYTGALNTPANKRFVKAYSEKYAKIPSWAAMQAYVNMMCIHKAIESLKGDMSDKGKLLTALKAVQLTESPKGPLKIDSYGNVVQNLYVRRVEKVNGQFQNTLIYTYPMVSQFRKYNPSEFMAQPVASRDYPPCKYCEPAK